ncbi:hypothetical protein [Brevibacillus nitrificans]|uniref:hypothetical protein n=1 Tax=Brevibacillus nitrificans TaxID=651560 RepID=UPI0026278536|nr:hypothetical protein [Brevibacillus nitrificans]MED1795164.1 hypothetical protein [Brevibacillus nitrificans]
MLENIPRFDIKLRKRSYTFLHLNQLEVGISVREELGYLALVDGKDSCQMLLLAAICTHLSQSKDFLFLERERAQFSDLILFNGAIQPITLKDIKHIKRAMKHHRASLISLSEPANDHANSSNDSWKYNNQLRVKADQHYVFINASTLGLQLLVEECLHLAESFSGYSHFDWYSTPSSVELLIRNIARND